MLTRLNRGWATWAHSTELYVEKTMTHLGLPIGKRPLEKNYKLFNPRLSPHTAVEPAPCWFWENFLALADQKSLVIENYAILNKRNIPLQQITTFEKSRSRESAVFSWCNASWYMKALQGRLCEQDYSENSVFSVNKAQTEDFIISINYNLPSTLFGH